MRIGDTLSSPGYLTYRTTPSGSRFCSSTWTVMFTLSPPNTEEPE